MREWVFPAVVLAVVTIALSFGMSGTRPVAGGRPPRRTRHKEWLGAVSDMLIGADGRWSTSKTMFTVWTYAVALVLLSILFLRNAASIADTGIDGSYLFLLGFPVGAAVIAKQVTVSSLTNGDLFKDDGTPSGNPLIDLAGDDTGRLDLGDFQYVLFNAVGVAYFIYLYHHAPAAGLPKLPSTLILLIAVSASAYIGKKALSKTRAPTIISLSSHTANPGSELFATAANVVDATKPLVDPANATVLSVFTPINNTVEDAAKERTASIDGDPQGSAELTRINFTVPADLPAGTYNLRLASYLGLRSAPCPLTITPPA